MIYSNKTNESLALFCANGRGIQRYDSNVYSIFDKLQKQQRGQFWTPDEIDLSQDKNDLVKSQEHEKFILTENIKQLIFLDSVQGRGLTQTLGRVCSNNELEALILSWQFFEQLHSESYTEIIRNVYPKPEVIFDDIAHNSDLLEKTEPIAKEYNDIYKSINMYENNEMSRDELMVKIIRFVVVINILEGVRFYSGFASIWAMHKSSGIFEGIAKVLKLIARDENLHLSASQSILKILKKTEPKAWSVFEPEITKMYEEAYEEELTWLKYLFSRGEILGLSEQILTSYVQFIINKRLKTLGLPLMFDISTRAGANPLPWISEYLDFGAVEVLPQEAQIINYNVGVLNTKEKLF